MGADDLPYAKYSRYDWKFCTYSFQVPCTNSVAFGWTERWFEEMTALHTGMSVNDFIAQIILHYSKARCNMKFKE